MLHLNRLTYDLGGRRLFDDATAHLPKGSRVALVGRNGAGKSTLLRLIREHDAHADSVRLRPGMKIGAVAQHAPDGPRSLLDTVLDADTERAALLDEAETATDPHRIADIQTRLGDIDAWTAPARAARILSGLGFDEPAQRRGCGEFSGGWRMRVALAAALFSAPDLLLLDEPSNHLDLEAALWLEEFLKTYPSTILLVSHDRDLLNKVPDMIWHLAEGRVDVYRGNYDAFERRRRERVARVAALATRQNAERQRIQAFIDRFRAKATKARQAQSRMKALARMEPIAGIVEERSIRFDFPAPDPHLSPPLMLMEGVEAGYGARPVLSGMDLRIDDDDRIALLGANGEGKSTFLRLVSGRIKPMGGKVIQGPKLRVGYFAQHQAEELPLSLSALDHMRRLMPMATEEKCRAHLGRFGFSQDMADRQIGKFSGGERARLLFASMARESPQLLLLDEPTNHLDLDAREGLVQALNAYEGAVILATHDPHLIELICDRLWLVSGGKVAPFEGDMEAYRAHLLETRKPAADAAKGAAGPTDTTRRDRRRDRALAREKLAPLRRAADKAEALMEKLNAEQARLESLLSDPGLYADPADPRPGRLTQELARLRRNLMVAEQAWLDAHAALETAEG